MMKYLFLVILLIVAATVHAQRRQYKVGDSLSCGIVFHVETDTFNRQRLLVSSLRDQSQAIAWNNGQFLTTRATRDRLFDKANADRVFDVQGNGNYAASLCRNFSFNDSACLIRDTLWYLPSVAELKLMYRMLDSAGKVSFAKEGYWSSVEYADPKAKRTRIEKRAMVVDFFNNRSFPVIKSNKYRVRAIREVIN